MFSILPLCSLFPAPTFRRESRPRRGDRYSPDREQYVFPYVDRYVQVANILNLAALQGLGSVLKIFTTT